MGVILSAASCLSWLSQLIGCKADLLTTLDRDPVPSGAPLFFLTSLESEPLIMTPKLKNCSLDLIIIMMLDT